MSIFSKYLGGQSGGGGGGGDVVGPSSSTDNSVPVFDGVTGKALKGSLLLIEGVGIGPAPGLAAGQIFYVHGTNAGDNSGNQGDDMFLQGGNGDPSSMTSGGGVYIATDPDGSGAVTRAAWMAGGTFSQNALMFQNNHLLFPNHSNLGATAATSGTDYRPTNAFFKGCVVVGNALGANPPYGLNNSLLAGLMMAGNDGANNAAFFGASNVFNGASASFMGFAKDGAFANAPSFVNGTGASNFDIYFSILHLTAPETQLIKFDGSSGDITTLTGKMLATAGIGVGNSASATIAVGTLTKKIEVFDAAGVSIGFVPVYATIT